MHIDALFVYTNRHYRIIDQKKIVRELLRILALVDLEDIDEVDGLLMARH